MPKQCKECGESIKDEAKFCPKCGTKQQNIDIYTDHQDADIYNKVLKIIADQSGFSENECSLDTSLVEDLGLDSLDLTELIIAFEEEFDIEISREDAQHIFTIRDILTF